MLTFHFLLTKCCSHCYLQHSVKSLPSKPVEGKHSLTDHLLFILPAWEATCLGSQACTEAAPELQGWEKLPSLLHGGCGWHWVCWEISPSLFSSWPSTASCKCCRNGQMERFPHGRVCLFFLLEQDALKKAQNKSQRSHQSFPTGAGTGQSTVENAFWNVGSVTLLVTKGWAVRHGRVWPIPWIKAGTDLTGAVADPWWHLEVCKTSDHSLLFSIFKLTLQVSKVLQLTSPFVGDVNYQSWLSAFLRVWVQVCWDKIFSLLCWRTGFFTSFQPGWCCHLASQIFCFVITFFDGCSSRKPQVPLSLISFPFTH